MGKRRRQHETKKWKRWHGLSKEIISGLVEWRQQHPKATFREIEAEIDKRLAELRAHMMSDAAMSSAQAEWEREGVGVCPNCGAKLEKKGKKKRKLQTRGGQEIELEREYGVCPMWPRFFPLDEELGLLPGSADTAGARTLVRLSCWMPFERAVEMFEDFMGIVVSRIDEPEVYRRSGSSVYEQAK